MAFYGKEVLQKARDALLRNQWACSKEWHGYITHLNFPKAFEKFGHLTLLKIFKSVMEEKRESLLINNFYFKRWAVKNCGWSVLTVEGSSPTGSQFQGCSQLCSPFIHKWTVEVCSSLLMQWISFSEMANFQLLKKHSEKSNIRLTSNTCRKLSWWSNKWQKRFNVNKCKVMHMAK